MSWIVPLLVALAAIPNASQRAERFRDVRIEKGFADFLKDRPLLMDFGGAEVIPGPGGQVTVIGVGKAMLGDGSAADVERAHRVAALKAGVAIVTELAGTRVCWERRETVTDIWTSSGEGGRLTRVAFRNKVLHERSAGRLEGVRPVGAWRSRDGSALYVAMGSVNSAAE